MVSCDANVNMEELYAKVININRKKRQNQDLMLPSKNDNIYRLTRKGACRVRNNTKDWPLRLALKYNNFDTDLESNLKRMELVSNKRSFNSTKISSLHNSKYEDNAKNRAYRTLEKFVGSEEENLYWTLENSDETQENRSNRTLNICQIYEEI